MSRNVLDILIPTYGRNEAAINAIDSCLKCNDSRFSVLCNSNEISDKLKYYSSGKDKLYYSQFDCNKGVRKNLSFLLKNSTARFCMFLSDEDVIQPESLSLFLDFLENIDLSTSVVYCSIYDLDKNNFFFKPAKLLDCIDIDINIFSSLRVVPTYISGLTFRIDDINMNQLNYIFNSSIANAYAHIDLSRKMLINKNLEFYSSRFIEKGRELNYGGESYEDVTKKTKLKESIYLNINVYGEIARARQFFYSNKELFNLRKSMNRLSYFTAQFRNLYTFVDATLLSEKITYTNRKSSLKVNIQVAKMQSIENNEISKSLFSKAYLIIFLVPRNIVTPLSFMLRYANNILKLYYMLFIFLTIKTNFIRGKCK